MLCIINLDVLEVLHSHWPRGLDFEQIQANLPKDYCDRQLQDELADLRAADIIYFNHGCYWEVITYQKYSESELHWWLEDVEKRIVYGS
jgi:methyltransferase-like protein